MLEQFFEDWKKEYTEATQGMIIKLEQKYTEVWGELMEDLQKRKTGLETDIADMKKEKEKEVKDIAVLTDKLIQISESIKKETETLKNIEEKQKAIIEKICEDEKKLAVIGDREKNVELKEKENREKEIELKARQININEQQNNLKRIFNKVK